ncbi:MAG: HemK2/MTQ2 family protein methyltransferase, partial [Solirubrobacterales bacterium]
SSHRQRCGGAYMKSVTPSPEDSIQIQGASGVYVPAVDSRMLIETFAERGPAPGAFVLDVCSGSGIQGIMAARAGHRVVSVDSTPEAVRATFMNALLNDVELEALRGDLFEPVDGWRFDAVLANPPYVPTPPGQESAEWCDGGPDGRAVIDRICTESRRVLAPGGALWMVHSSLADIPRSLEMLESAGFDATVVACEELELGPVSRSRLNYLTDGGFISEGLDSEQLAVIEARLAG